MQIPDFLATLTRPTPCRSNADAYLAKTTRTAAAILCHGCPVLTACRTWAVQHGEPGTWGGTIAADRTHYRNTGTWPRGRRPKPNSPRRRQMACGTAATLERHRRAGEECVVCWDGTLAHLDRLVHGTRQAYRLELLLGVDRCELCREWLRRQSEARRARAAAGGPVGGSVVRMPVRESNGRQAGSQRLAEAS